MTETQHNFIPNTVVQTSFFKPYSQYVELFQDKCDKYFHFTDNEIIDFFDSNPIQDFPNPTEIFKNINIGQHRADFFRYYYLYIYGGFFIDSDATLEVPLSTIINKNPTFFIVESCDHRSLSFNGFIGAVPRHPIIYSCLKYFYTSNIYQHDYFDICRNLWDNYLTYKETYSSTCNIIKCCEEYNEKKTFASTKFNNDILLNHYFSDKTMIYNTVTFTKNPRKKIGITMALFNNANDIFNSGIQQNVLFFAELLLNIGCYDIFICVSNILSSVDMNYIKYDNRFNFVHYTRILEKELDVLVVLGYVITNDSMIQHLKCRNTKIVYYKCGNDYMLDGEMFLYNSSHTGGKHERMYDEIWCIPQMAKMNKSYWEILYKVPCKIVPFVWSPIFIDKNDLLFKPKKNTQKQLAIFEPNISIMKFCIPPLVICEKAYQTYKEIERIFVMNISSNFHEQKHMNVEGLENIVDVMDIHKDNKVFIEGRKHPITVMKHHADVAISHTLENPLNYIYLELAYMGYAIVHNGYLCKKIGYYYEDYDFQEGSEVLLDALNHHNENYQVYLKRNRKHIEKYLPSYKQSQKKYQRYIENICSQ